MSGLTAVAVDPGSCYLKAGYSGRAVPSLVIPNAVGYTRKAKDELEEMGLTSLKNEEDGSSSTGLSKSGKETIDEHIKRKRAEMVKLYDLACLGRYSEKKHIIRPMFRGELVDEGAFGDVMEYTISRFSSTMDTPVFLAIPPNTDTKTAFRMTEILIEENLTPSVGLMYSSPLTLIAAGRTTGLAVEAGYSMCCVSPVYDGTILKKRSSWNTVSTGMGLEALVYEYARRDLKPYIESENMNMNASLPKIFSSENRNSSLEFTCQEWTRDLIQQLTYQSRELRQPTKLSLEVSCLPDGTPIEGDNPLYVSFPAGDEFVVPNSSLSLYPEYYGGMIKASNPLSLSIVFNFAPLLRTVLCPMTDASVRALIGTQSGSIVPSGGLMEAVTPQTSALGTLKLTVETLLPAVRTRVAAPTKPSCALANAACMGASILSSLGSSAAMYISRGELAETGLRAVCERLD